MPKQLVFMEVPVRLSIVKYDPAGGEELFLTYTRDRINGPILTRSGVGPPVMRRVRPRVPGETTTHPFGQRVGSWLIQIDLKRTDAKEVLEALKGEVERCYVVDPQGSLPNGIKVLKDCLDKIDPQRPDRDQALNDLIELCGQRDQAEGQVRDSIRVLKDYLYELPTNPAHDDEFTKVYPGWTIIGQQGCGDLTMNLWNVAYVNSPFVGGNRPPVLIHPFEEPIDQRTYSCLVKWRPAREDGRRYTIEDVRFSTVAQQPSGMVFTRTDGEWTAKGDRIEFAVYGKQIIRLGKVVNVSRITQEFSDLRHLVQLPNLNPMNQDPENPDPRREPLFPGDSGRPRFYFGRSQDDDVWFGEAELLHDVNLQRAATGKGPVILSRLYRGLGASQLQIRGAMRMARYDEISDSRQPLEVGQYRFVPEDDTLVDVYLKRNTYRWSMIGLPNNGDSILSLACEGKPGGSGYVLRSAAKHLMKAGACDALLIDEGQDVFQAALLGHSGPKRTVAGGGPGLDHPVELRRTRLRATFIFASPLAVVGVDGNTITASVTADQTRTFTVTDKTKYTRAGADVTLADIQKGSQISVGLADPKNTEVVSIEVILPAETGKDTNGERGVQRIDSDAQRGAGGADVAYKGRRVDR